MWNVRSPWLARNEQMQTYSIYIAPKTIFYKMEKSQRQVLKNV